MTTRSKRGLLAAAFAALGLALPGCAKEPAEPEHPYAAEFAEARERALNDEIVAALDDSASSGSISSPSR